MRTRALDRDIAALIAEAERVLGRRKRFGRLRMVMLRLFGRQALEAACFAVFVGVCLLVEAAWLYGLVRLGFWLAG